MGPMPVQLEATRSRSTVHSPILFQTYIFRTGTNTLKHFTYYFPYLSSGFVCAGDLFSANSSSASHMALCVPTSFSFHIHHVSLLSEAFKCHGVVISLGLGASFWDLLMLLVLDLARRERLSFLGGCFFR